MQKGDCSRYLSNSGYIIRKKNLSPRQENKIRKDLTVRPFENLKFMKQTYGPPPTPFKVFCENQNKFYVPRFWAMRELGEPEMNLINERGEEINIDFDGKLNEAQKLIMDEFIPHLKKTGGGILNLRCGMGKCLAKGTPVLMFDGTIKSAECIKVDDLLMGDDCKKRRVISITSDREKMATISHYDGEYTVNMSHILSLKSKTGQLYDMSVKQYLKYKGDPLYGYRIPIQFEKKYTHTDPYQFGSFLHNITMKRIPDTYIFNEAAVRSNFLAGFIDQGKYYDGRLPIPRNEMKNQLIFLIRSLGIGCLVNNDTDIDENRFIQIYHHDENELQKLIPTRNPNQKIKLSPQFRHNPLLFEISIQVKHVDYYYGFELDEKTNRRFCLGDCTVTHNTVLALNLISVIKTKTLIVVHKGFLLDQWVARIKQFLPTARIGIIQQQKIIVDQCDIVLAMLQSIAIKTYPEETFSNFGMTIVDECHHAAAEVFSRALSKVSTKYMVGLSATLDRKDGLRRVFEWYLGDVAVSVQKQDVGTVLVDVIKYEEESMLYKRMEYTARGFIKYNILIDNVVNSPVRNALLIEQVKVHHAEGRNILLITERRTHVDMISQMLETINIDSGKYMGSMKKEQLQESEQKKVILGTYNMISEGFDVAALDTLIFATPKSDIEQAAGRILRQGKNRTTTPKIIDIYDVEIKPFETRLKARQKFYKQHKYTISNV